MKNAIFALLAIAIVSLLVMMLIHRQDEEYERYSEQAKRDCQLHRDKTLVYDEDLRYFKRIRQ